MSTVPAWHPYDWCERRNRYPSKCVSCCEPVDPHTGFLLGGLTYCTVPGGLGVLTYVCQVEADRLLALITLPTFDSQTGSPADLTVQNARRAQLAQQDQDWAAQNLIRCPQCAGAKSSRIWEGFICPTCHGSGTRPAGQQIPGNP